MRRILPLERLRWITFGHVEADECGAMNEFLAAAPRAQVARVLYGETTGTLFCGDLFTHLGNGPAVTDQDLVEPALQSEELFRQTSCLTAATATLRSLAALRPRTLAVMHGSSSQGDGASALNSLAEALEQRFAPESGFATRQGVLGQPHS